MKKTNKTISWSALLLMGFFFAGVSPVNIQPALAEPVSQIELNAPDHAPININTASAVELSRIRGVGPTIAQRIVVFRDSQGPFSSTEDLALVKGIGGVKLQKIKQQITV